MTDTRKQALIDLLGKVKAGDIPDTGVDRFSAIPTRGGGVYSDPNWYDAHSAYWRGSLDAAKALHEAVLPGCSWGVGDTRSGVYIGGQYCSECVRESPARAWLIAILKALISECDA